MRLRVRRGVTVAAPARLADFMPTADALALHTDGREHWLSVLRPGPGRLIEDRYVIDPVGAQMVDRTVFGWDAQHFIEADRRTTRDGPNLHAAPIVLPALMEHGQGAVVPAGRVSLVHHGLVQLRLGPRCWQVQAIALVGEEDGSAQVQWLARGVGPIALGPLGAPPARWCVAFSGAVPWPEPVPDAIRALPRSPLRAGPPGPVVRRLL